jgi:cell division protein FtsB
MCTENYLEECIKVASYEECLEKLRKEINKNRKESLEETRKIIETELSRLQKQKVQLEKEIELYEEDWTVYEEEQLEEINKKMNYLINILEKIDEDLLNF